MAQHRLSEKDIEALTAICKICGPVKIRKSGTTPKGSSHYRCANYVKERIRSQEDQRKLTGYPYRPSPWRLVMEERLAKGKCEKCPFIAVVSSQLEIDHKVRKIDGGTDDIDNLWVLCANCHKLKTHYERKRLVKELNLFLA